LWALPLQAFYKVCSDRQPTAQLDYNLLVRWLAANDQMWDATVSCEYRDRPLNGDVVSKSVAPLTRTQIEEPFASTKTISALRKTSHCGR
jgi:transposase